MFERERATGECECGDIVYGAGIYCENCLRFMDVERSEEMRHIFHEERER